MIKSYTDADMLDGLKRLDHVFYSLPTEGGKAALQLLEEEERRGYGFLHYLHDEFSLPLEDAPAKDFSAETLGTMWDFEDEDSVVSYHGVYNHSYQRGWHPAAYEIVGRRLDSWWEEHEDDIVRPCRSLVLGEGRSLRKVAEPDGGTNWNMRLGFGVMANTELEFACYYWSETE